jgi:hypothetical protein
MARPSVRSPVSSITRATPHARFSIIGSPVPGPSTGGRFAPVQPILDQILRDDADAPPKQRHTAMQTFRRLRDEQCCRGG